MYTKKGGPVSNVLNPVMLLFWFGSYKQFPNNSHVSLCDIIFMYNHKYKA